MENDRVRDTAGPSGATGGGNEEGHVGEESNFVGHNLASENIIPIGQDEPEPAYVRSSHQDDEMTRILFGLCAIGNEGSQLDSLFQLCQLLSFGSLYLLRGFSVGSFVPLLVRFLHYKHNPDMRLLAARALTHLCDVLPNSCALVAGYGAILSFRDWLLTIEHVDQAEQALQALEKISRKCPKDCLRAGALSAVLLHLDFFSTNLQRVAVSTAANVCRKLPSDAADYVMEAIPTLINVLRYQDTKVVEHACVCLTRIVERFASAPEKLVIVCSHGLISQVAFVISLRKSATTSDSKTSLSTASRAGLIRLLSTCASRLAAAAESLLLVGISCILKDNVAEYGLASNAILPHQLLYEILTLVNELLPPIPESTRTTVRSKSSNGTDVSEMGSEKHSAAMMPSINSGEAGRHASKETGVREKFFFDQPHLLVQFGVDLFPVLVQFYGSSLDLSVQTKCLAAIHKLLHFSTSAEFLGSLQKESNISSFLAGVLASRDASILITTLQMAEILLQKNLDVFAKAFVKEGVLHSINELLKSSRLSVLLVTAVQTAKSFKKRYISRCRGLSIDQSTETVRKLKTLCAKLNGETAEDFKGIPRNSGSKSFNEGAASMSEILGELGSDDGLSTFEFQESGIVSSLLSYFGVRNVSENELRAPKFSRHRASQRFKQFVEVALPLVGDGKEVPLSTLLRQLQNSLASELASSELPEFSAANRAYHANDAQYELWDDEFFSNKEPNPVGWTGVDVHDIEMAGTELISHSLCFTGPSAAGGIERGAVHTARTEGSWRAQVESILKSIVEVELPFDLEKKDSPYNILLLLRILEQLNRVAPRLHAEESQESFVESGNTNNLIAWKTFGPVVQKERFLSRKLTSKLAWRMYEALPVDRGQLPAPLPAWCHQLIKVCPFLFSFETRLQYFHSTASGLSRARQRLQQLKSRDGPAQNHHRELRIHRLRSQKVRVSRHNILEAAAKVMELYSGHSVVLEVEYFGEVGTGLGPTLEFYTIVSHELQRISLDMWRTDSSRDDAGDVTEVGNAEGGDRDGKCSSLGMNYVCARQGLFPRPWLPGGNTVANGKYATVMQRFRLLGRVAAKALQDGRMLDLPLSSAFYKLILGKKLDSYDIAQSIDPELGRTLQEMHILARRKQFLEKLGSDSRRAIDALRFRDSRIEDLFLDFTLPGYPDYSLKAGGSEEMVNLENLEEYVSLLVDATVNKGIIEQFEAFCSGFNDVFKLSTLQIFDEDELESLLCGRLEQWKPEALPNLLKFDHGYNASSAPIQHLLELMGEFTPLEQQQFLRFVTGAPKLPPGGLSVLSPKLTIVRKHPSGFTGASAGATGPSCETTLADGDLPSVMTCANYLKLPPYSCKEVMRDRLMFAIREGQGSFDLS